MRKAASLAVSRISKLSTKVIFIITDAAANCKVHFGIFRRRMRQKQQKEFV